MCKNSKTFIWVKKYNKYIFIGIHKFIFKGIKCLSRSEIKDVLKINYFGNYSNMANCAM